MISTRSNYLLLGVFSVLAFTGIFSHELWSDEVHHWFIARDSNSLAELYANLRDDWHPILWNILLFIIARFTHDVLYMQVLHGIIVVTAAAVFLFRSPFSGSQKSLFLLGYFPLYEYAVFSRNYSLLFLGLVCALSLFPDRKNSKVLMAICLFFLANTHLLGTLMAGAFIVVIVRDDFLNDKPSTSRIIVPAVALVGVILALFQVVPSDDTGIIRHWVSDINAGDLYRALVFAIKGFIPIPDFTGYHFWNHFLFERLPMWVIVPAAVCVGVLPFYFLATSRTALLFFSTAAMGMFGFSLLGGLSGTRYLGVVFLAFVAGVWMQSSEVTAPTKRTARQSIFIVLLIIQALAGISAWWLDVRRPFSESKNLANYIRENKLVREPILMDNCLRASCLAYLDTRAYFLSSSSLGSYCEWDKMGYPVQYLADSALVSRALRFTRSQGRDALLITNKPLTGLRPSIYLLSSFDKSIIETESFWLYRVNE